MDNTQKWYIVKRPDGPCEILPSTQIEGGEEPTIVERWGPFDSQQDAIRTSRGTDSCRQVSACLNRS